MIYNVGLSDDFADQLVHFILSQTELNPFEMANTQIILPTKRAVKTIKDAFLRASQSQSLLLPKLMALYELDDIEQDIPPKMSSLNRTLLLAKLCMAKPNISSPDKAVTVAVGLGALLDEFYQYEVDMSRLNELVKESQFADHWNETVQFLDIIHTAWPQILKERHQIDEMDYHMRMIHSYVRKWSDQPPLTPVIMAGFDGAIPAVIRLAQTVQKLPKGFIILNGLDEHLCEKDFKELPENHYQYGIKKLLDALNIKLHQVKKLTQTPGLSSAYLIHEAFKPADKTDSWQYLTGMPADSLTHVTRYDCDSSKDEAVMVSMLMRQVLETPSKTAAFVTTDRTLARRVILEMKRWDILLDDSAGTPLHQTPVGTYLLLLAQAAVQCHDANALLALLKHPLSADKSNPSSLRLKVKQAEKDARRQHQKFKADLKTDLHPFFALFQNNILVPFKELLSSHIEMAQSLATSHDKTGVERLWTDDAGQTAFVFLTELLSFGELLGEIEPGFYPTILKLLMEQISVRPKYGMHPRLDILGPIEARLHQADVMIIGGLNEGTFPQLQDAGPWLNRPMRKVLGLPSLENKIAIAAMDFATCFCSKEVFITRSLKEEGSPTIPSRFLSRIEAVLTAVQMPWMIKKPDWAALIDQAPYSQSIQRPAPKPPVSARPRSLSVTKIELWMRDPYAIYARYILKLYPLDPIEDKQKQLLFGNAVHKALERFLNENSHATDEKKLMAFGLDSLRSFGFDEGDLAFYMPKFEQIAKWFLQKQTERLDRVLVTYTEQKGQVVLSVPGGDFTLTGTADRIDLLNDGTVEIIDYKTGTVPSAKEVKAGYSPQLPLEGYILSQAGFKEISSNNVSNLSYWKLSGTQGNSKTTSLMTQKTDQVDIIRQAADGVKNLIKAFDCENTPYESCPAPEKAPRYNEYEHLSRAKEWLNIEEDEEDA